MDRQTLISDVNELYVRDDLGDTGILLRLAESEINRDIRVADQETVAELSVLENGVDLPADFLDVRAASFKDSRRPLQGATIQHVKEQQVSGANSGRTVYAQIANTFEFAPTVEDGEIITLVYFRRYAPLLVDTDTNWLLLNEYDVYLYCIGEKAGTFIVDAERENFYRGKYMETVEKVRREQHRRRRLPQPRSSRFPFRVV